MGNLIQPQEDWWKPNAEVPDGSYALFRSDENKVELLSDMLATRTIWYIQTEKVFIAATSQRAIIFFLQEFRPNRDVYAWMLSSGTIGPGLSWDSRIKCLSGNSRLVLDRSSWKVNIHMEPVQFSPVDRPAEEHESKLRERLEYIFGHLRLDYSKWVLPLSGGVDSRAILLFLKDRGYFKCITWGLRSSLKDKKNDAHIAKSLTEYFGLGHEYFETDLSEEPLDLIFNRFLVAGEGRIDHIPGYMDGFRIWKHLFESKYQGIIRGDQVFGCRAANKPETVYKNMGLHILSDYENLNPLKDVIEEFHQEHPSYLKRSEIESLESWRDRVNAEFEVPVIFAALNDIKLPYVEIINPFLSRSIVHQVRQFPDDLRTDKRLFRTIVNSLNPDIPYAQCEAVAKAKAFPRTQNVIYLIRNVLGTDHAKTLLPEELIRFILHNMKTSEPTFRINSFLLYRLISLLIPKRTKKLIKTKTMKHNLDLNTLGLRACLICKMDKILSSDANALSQAS